MFSRKKNLETSSMIACPVCDTDHLPTKRNLTSGVYAGTCGNCGHFFKFKATENFKSSVSFSINGVQYTAGNEVDPATSLVEFMRQKAISVGTKGCCYEGGCGVCLVAVKLFDPISQQLKYMAVNSCCLQLFTCDGFEIITIEGLGNPKTGLHPIQAMLAQYDGAQCGFCSPGQVMNMYGILQKTTQPTIQQIEDEFDATICRCTGYRSILDAMKSFAVDAPANLNGGVIDIEELDAKLCKKTGQVCNGHCRSEKDCTSGHHIPAHPLHIVGAGTQWIKPLTITDLLNALGQHSNENYRLVFGNTSFGVYQEFGPWNFDILIDIRSVKELCTIESTGTSIILGANLSISTLIDLFEQAQGTTVVPATIYGRYFVDHLKQIAHHGIRNLCCWAGNLMLKRYHPEFPSDIFLLWESVAAKLIIYNSDKSQSQYSLPDFLNLDMKGKLIYGVSLPLITSANVQIRTYRTALRLQACQAYVSAGFNFELDSSKNYLVIGHPSIVIQGISAKMIHATQTEGYLQNKPLGNPVVLKTALSILSSELMPESYPNWASPVYRKSLAVSLFYKYVLDVCQAIVAPTYISGGHELARTPIIGTQSFDTNKTKWPVTEPISKITAPYLTSGQVQYLDDLPRTPGELSAAVVISSVGNAMIDKIDASQALKLPGVVAFIQASDIPKGGVNNWRPLGIFSDIKEELLSSGQILYAGQPIGIIVADIETTAQTAASMVQVTYKNIQPVIVDIQDAIQKKSFFPNKIPQVIAGDAETAITNAAHKISGSIACGDQYHFHLETQTTICTPTDLGGMKVKASTQWIDGVVETVAQILGLPQSEYKTWQDLFHQLQSDFRFIGQATYFTQSIMTEKCFKSGSTQPPLKPGLPRLYSNRFCPFAQRTRLVLVYKNITFETVNIDLKKKPDWLWQKNPLGLVPVLEIDDKILYESTATCEWLDDIHPENRLQPSDPYRKAWDRILLEYYGKFTAAFFALFFGPTLTPEEKELYLETIRKAYRYYEDALFERGGPFFGGKSPAMIDFFIWPHFERIPAVAKFEESLALDRDSYPKLVQWFEAMYSRPEVKATMFDVQTHLIFLQSYKSGSPCYDYGLDE